MRSTALILLLFLPALGFGQAPTPAAPDTLKAARQAAEKGDIKLAVRLLEEEAEKGNPDAAFGLAELHVTGKGGEASLAKALKWYEKSEQNGSALAQLRMGEIFILGGDGVEKDEVRGLFHIQSAAEAGVAPAWTKLGQLSETAAQAADATPDRQKLFSEARSHFKKGAEAGNLESQHAYALLLANGKGGKADIPAAMDWLRKSANEGFARSMNDLGLRLKDGEGIDKDPVAALGWFLAGAERGSLTAITNLGLCYENGIGVPPNPQTAGSWYAKASKLNYAPAQYLLGQLFEQGLGTDRNLVFAYVNYSRAAASNFGVATEARDALKSKLSSEQLKQAKDILAPPSPKGESGQDD